MKRTLGPARIVTMAGHFMGSTILVMDAEPVVRTVVTAILEREGHTVHAKGDVGEAVRLVRANHPDLLLTNVLLPGMRGHDGGRPETIKTRISGRIPRGNLRRATGAKENPRVGKRWAV